MKNLIIIILSAFVLFPGIAHADRWFGCGKIQNLNHYGTSEVRFDIEGADYTNICQYQGVTSYGHHSLAKTPENQWIFAMYLAAAISGKQVALYSSDVANGPCPVVNVPIKYCE